MPKKSNHRSTLFVIEHRDFEAQQLDSQDLKPGLTSRKMRIDCSTALRIPRVGGSSSDNIKYREVMSTIVLGGGGRFGFLAYHAGRPWTETLAVRSEPSEPETHFHEAFKHTACFQLFDLLKSPHMEVEFAFPQNNTSTRCSRLPNKDINMKPAPTDMSMS